MRRLPSLRSSRAIALFADMAALAAACGRSNLGLDDAEGIGGGGASASPRGAHSSCGGDDCNSLIDCGDDSGGMNAAVIDIPSLERSRPYA